MLVLTCRCSPQMADLMHSTVQQRIYDRIVIIDCRFPYEFDGGHIKGAVNITNADDLENLLLESEHLAEMGSRLCLIFHCEFSSQRGPKLCVLRPWYATQPILTC
jgi:M-phase inducer phosphatase 2